MTTEPMITPMSEDEARTLVRKVAAWAETLEPNEQAAIGEIVRRAGATAGESAGDVAGYKFGDHPADFGIVSGFNMFPGLSILGTIYVIARDTQVH